MDSAQIVKIGDRYYTLDASMGGMAGTFMPPNADGGGAGPRASGGLLAPLDEGPMGYSDGMATPYSPENPYGTVQAAPPPPTQGLPTGETRQVIDPNPGPAGTNWFGHSPDPSNYTPPVTPTPVPVVTPIGTTPTPTTPAPTTPAPTVPTPTTPAGPGVGVPANPATGGAIPSAVPVPAAPVAPTPFVMPAEPGMEDASVAKQLTGLLAADSPYMQLARQSGLRTAARRGLRNSSLAAGASEAAAIAAGAPIASQDAAQIHQRNQSRLDAWNALRNTTTVQGMQEAGANYRQLSGERNAIILNNSTNQAAFDRLMAQGEIEKAMEVLRSANNMKQAQLNAQVSIVGNYMTAFGQLASNPELPASARSAYQLEFLRVTNQTQALINALAGVQVTFPTAAPAG